MSDVDRDQYLIEDEPYYLAVDSEVEIYTAAYDVRMPVMLKGPTGCGKTRFVEYMAWKLKRPLITVACNEDMTASDLVGRFLLDIDGTRWQDGPLTVAARIGAICYLDEVVEARQDTTVVIHPLTDHRRELPLEKKGEVVKAHDNFTTVVIHPLTDHRRELPLEKKGEVVKAHDNFQIVISYNPGYQSLMKDLKQSTKQRFGGIDFNYPETETEVEIVRHEGGVENEIGTAFSSLYRS
jgi:nitric oxide reductase NorQ protein